MDLYVLVGEGFERRLRLVRDWVASAPCTEWNVRQLVNHMVRGNVNYVALLEGGTGGEFLRLREADALGVDPLDAYEESVGQLVAAFGRPGALGRSLDYPLGKARGDRR